MASFPVALLCLERAGAGPGRADARLLPLRHRLLWLAAFGAVFGLQLFAGFPQSAYICALVYAALVAARCSGSSRAGRRRPRRAGPRVAPALKLALGALAAVALGTSLGMAALLPLREMGAISDRSGGGTFAWATRYNYDRGTGSPSSCPTRTATSRT